MASSRSFRRFVEKELGELPHFLIYAILEWVMIFLLFFIGFLAFLSNEFARFFELRLPCLLCTRIDHLLVHKNPDFYYNDTMCEAHKKDISSLAYCHVHRTLSDIWSMCEGCLLSFSTEKESDRDTYRSLVGILHKDIDSFVEDDHKIQLKSGGRRDDVRNSPTPCPVYRCSCCGEPLRMRSSSRSTMTRSSSINASLLSQAPAPSPRTPMMTLRYEEPRNLDLPHIRYTELKFISDNESEHPEDEDGSNADNQSTKEENKAVTAPLLPEPEEMTPSFTRGNKFFGIPLSDSAAASPRFSTRFPRKLQIEKSELFLESTDTNRTNEADRDSILQQLKRQVRLDRKSMIALCMELDEERSASAVAANNAMAMITRLQAEKAAVQMEALQYQRMMDEQAEYDQEAIQVMKNLLIKREDEVKDMAVELETYREKYGLIRKISSEECVFDAEDYQEFKSQTFSSECGSPREVDQTTENGRQSGPLQEENGGTFDESSFDFDRERSYLLGQLTDLEKKINFSSGEEPHSSESNSDITKHEDKNTGQEIKADLTREMSQIKERLRAIEADSGFLKHTAMTLQKGGDGTKLLTEIAHHLRKLRQPLKMPPEDMNA
ncbi:probable myosin-binding protein 5 [Cornus florida]|uniref:probable myosin-binding protein 5 n=1 Tax=Cornus florida TaxID=4283 RepID=UPI00289CB5BB|nr:probable myosin-binding protein 5 [Cornus florida]